jgi:hypothetical protein
LQCGNSDIQGLQAIEQGTLSWNDLFLSNVEREPLRSIDLWKVLSTPASRRPLHLKHIALDRAYIEIAFQGESHDTLSAALDHLAQGLRQSSWRSAAKFLLKFAERGKLGRLVSVIFAFGDRPRLKVAIPPEGSAGMDKKHFENPAPATIDE